MSTPVVPDSERFTVQSERLSRRIASLHEQLCNERHPLRRKHDISLYAGGQLCLQLAWDGAGSQDDKCLVQAIQYANLRFPFDEVLVADLQPSGRTKYVAVSREGGYAEDEFQRIADGTFVAVPGPVFLNVDPPPYFVPPSEGIPSRIRRWVDSSIAHGIPKRLLGS